MSKKHKQHHEEEMGEAWLLPYSDLMTLLLAVFIVLFAVSNVDQAKANAMAEAFAKVGMVADRGGYGYDKEVDGESKGGSEEDKDNKDDKNSEDAIATAAAMQAELLGELQSLVDSKLKELGVEGKAFIDDRGLVVRLNAGVMFASGRDELSAESIETLRQVGEILKSDKVKDHYISIDGHTDSMPINTVQFRDNWMLSSGRAGRVLNLFTNELGFPIDRLSVKGYADSRPLDTNETEEGRAKNRRVEIILLNSEYNALEEQRN
ncbi:MAG: flagellar motor protein MotB [Ruminococcus sp.]|jgi:chemotaxis protein MotB|nr:flagellar motor protein MotB [Ruminococcus sp.]